MNFIFGTKKAPQPKAKENERPKEDDAIYSQLQLAQLAEQNEQLKVLIEDQRETAQLNKRLLGTLVTRCIDEYVGHVTTQEQLVPKLQRTIEEFQAKISTHDIDIEEQRYSHLFSHRIKRAQLEVAKSKTEGGKKPPPRSEADRCRECGRRMQITEDSSALLLEQQRLSAEISRAKDELNALAKALQERHKSPESPAKGDAAESIQGLFNLNNMDSLQDLLDQAEESEQALLFVDNKGNIWQITQRRDLNLPEEELPEDAFGPDAEPHEAEPEDQGPEATEPKKQSVQPQVQEQRQDNELLEEQHSERTPPSETN